MREYMISDDIRNVNRLAKLARNLEREAMVYRSQFFVFFSLSRVTF